jgi:hypothetical protein
MRLLEAELAAILAAYLLAAIPVGAAWVAGRVSPLYRLPTYQLCRWWSWFALILVAAAVTLAAAR